MATSTIPVIPVMNIPKLKDIDSVQFERTSANTIIIIFWTSYVSTSNNSGYRLVLLQANWLRFESITNGNITTIWEK